MKDEWNLNGISIEEAINKSKRERIAIAGDVIRMRELVRKGYSYDGAFKRVYRNKEYKEKKK
jgi:hypothetical protein